MRRFGFLGTMLVGLLCGASGIVGSSGAGGAAQPAGPAVAPASPQDDEEEEHGGDILFQVVSRTMKNSVLYSHEAHLEAGCSCEDCHDGLFEKEFGKARFTMSDVNKGKACGVCHQVDPPEGVKAAFPPRNRETRENNCEKCHSIRVREPTKRRR